MFPLRDNIPSRTFPIVNDLIIIANIIVFIRELRLARVDLLDPFLLSHSLIPLKFMMNPLAEISTLFSAMFLHGGWAHVIGNMWFLYIFGDSVEDALGHIRYFFYYLLMGMGAAMVQIAAHPGSSLPMIGASGAIAGVLGSYFVLYPRARVLSLFVIFIFIRVIEVPAFFFLGFWFLTQAFNGIGSLSHDALRGELGGVAWWAHAGGFVTGFLSIFFFKKRRKT